MNWRGVAHRCSPRPLICLPHPRRSRRNGPTGEATTSATATTRIAAEFTRKIDTKDAKVGDDVLAQITSDAVLADGTPLPRGTRLTGTVTEVLAKSNAAKYSHLAITFHRAIVPDGHRQFPCAPSPEIDVGKPRAVRRFGQPAEYGRRRFRAGRVARFGFGGRTNAGLARPGATAGAASTGTSAGGLAGSTVGGLDAGIAAEVPIEQAHQELNDSRVDNTPATGDLRGDDALQLHRGYTRSTNMPGVILCRAR